MVNAYADAAVGMEKRKIILYLTFIIAPGFGVYE